MPNSVVRDVQLHVFSDAPLQAYVCDFCISYSYTSVDTVLVMSNAQVAPIKQFIIPNLKLKGAVIATQLAETIY